MIDYINHHSCKTKNILKKSLKNKKIMFFYLKSQTNKIFL